MPINRIKSVRWWVLSNFVTFWLQDDCLYNDEKQRIIRGTKIFHLSMWLMKWKITKKGKKSWQSVRLQRKISRALDFCRWHRVKAILESFVALYLIKKKKEKNRKGVRVQGPAEEKRKKKRRVALAGAGSGRASTLILGGLARGVDEPCRARTLQPVSFSPGFFCPPSLTRALRYSVSAKLAFKLFPSRGAVYENLVDFSRLSPCDLSRCL